MYRCSVLVCLASVTAAWPLHGQETDWRLGISGGVFSEGRGGRALMGGVSLEWVPERNVGLEASLLWTNRIRAGNSSVRQVVTPEGPALVDVHQKESYRSLELPLLGIARLPFTSDDQVALFIAAGPVITYAFGCSASIESVTTSIITGTVISEDKLELATCTSQAGGLAGTLMVGGGLDLHILATRLRLSARYFGVEDSDRVLTWVAQLSWKFW